MFRKVIFFFLGIFSLAADPILEDEHERIFTDIYKNCIWGVNAAGEGFSGGGSLLENCRSYINLLQNVMLSFSIRTVVDAGCGDWEFSRHVDWSEVSYKGYDIVGAVIEKNRMQFSRPNIEFFQANFLKEPLPPADLLLCKHVLQHLTNQDIIEFIPKLKNYKYCLITNEIFISDVSNNNLDILIGGGRKVDLTKPPFNVKGTKLLTYHIGSSVHQVLFIDNTFGQGNDSDP